MLKPTADGKLVSIIMEPYQYGPQTRGMTNMQKSIQKMMQVQQVTAHPLHAGVRFRSRTTVLLGSLGMSILNWPGGGLSLGEAEESCDLILETSAGG